MEVLLLAIYAAIVWFVFIKMKWLPWNTGTQVTVVIIPIVALTALILSLNVVAPSSADVRVIKYVINIVPQVRGRVIEVPVEPNRLVKKGDVLFRIDPTPYELTVRSLEAQLANAVAGSRELGEQLIGAQGKVVESRGAIQQSEAKIREVQTRLDLARTRVAQNRELVATGAGDRFALEKAQTDLAELEAQLDTARASPRRPAPPRRRPWRASASSRSAARARSTTSTRRSRTSARSWPTPSGNSSRRRCVAPADGYPTNVQLRPGSFTTAFPITPAMTFVEEKYQVVALFHQNELQLVEEGNEAEFTLKAHPGRIIKASVESIVWAQGQGQVANTTQLPMTGVGPMPPGRFPVRLTVAERDSRPVPAGRRDRPGRDLHGARGGHPDPAQGLPAGRRQARLPRPEAALIRCASRSRPC